MVIYDETEEIKFYFFSIGKDSYKTNSLIVKSYIKYKDKNKLGLKKQKQRFEELENSYIDIGFKKIKMYHIFKNKTVLITIRKEHEMEEKFEQWYEEEGKHLAFNAGLKDDEITKSLLRQTWTNGFFESE